MQFQIQDFRLFLEVAELGSFTKVAARRQTVQSHISRQISELEKACGSPLFRRTGRGVALTEFGQHVERRVRLWLNGCDELFAEIRQTSTVPMGEVRIGILPSVAHPLMSHVFNRLRLDYPRIVLNVREGQGGELDAMLDTGGVDMAILFRFDNPRSQDEILLATADTYLVSSPGAVRTQGETVAFKMLENLPLVLPRRPAHWRSILDETARSQGFHLQAVIDADSLRLQKQVLIDNPNLYALLGPFSIDEELRQGKLQAAKLVAPDLKRYVTLAHPKWGQLTQASRIVSQLICETVQTWGGRMKPLAPADTQVP
ncbi:LysR family transcriptional regulator [Hylemonella gracilis]|jgi:DNA-binding transcriptional LysR family regulator|uniref:LysR family transcriptional regulator n=1 Tax=Hylemonella gracilis TaxID=80880 RepID=A0A4P6UH99_9BURK|nr:LysR family transcriptional regulator [Hylemonella gracilis]QBK03440.1 LysR family transcriptional regulator [Hylemonella gracilis]